MRQRHRRDNNKFDDDDMLSDGQRLRVPLTLMDGMDPTQRAVAREGLRVTDGSGGSIGLHRPGFRITADDARNVTKRDAVYADYERRLCDAWKTPTGLGGDPSITGFGQRGSVGQREGGTGMLDCEENAEDIVRNAATRRDHRTVEQMMRDHQNKMADIYDKLDHELSETWRGS